MKIFFCIVLLCILANSVFYFCYVHTISVLYYAHLCMKCSLGISIFLKRSLVFPVWIVSSISLHWSLQKAFLSLLAILWNSAFRWVYLSFSPLPFSSICKVFSDSHLVSLDFFFLGMILITVSCTMSWTSVHSSSALCLPDLIPSIYLLLPLYNRKGFYLGHNLMA